MNKTEKHKTDTMETDKDCKHTEDTIYISQEETVFIDMKEINRMEQTIGLLEKMEQDWINFKKKYNK